MELSENTVEWLKSTTQLAADLEIDGLIFDQDGIRGYNDEDAIIMICAQNLGFEFDSLGIAGVPEFRRKMKIVEGRSDVLITANPNKENSDKISSLTIKGKKIKYDFRCADPSRIPDLPKKSFPINPLFTFQLTKEDIKTFKEAATALRNQNVVVQGDATKIQFTFSDISGDTMVYSLDSPLTTHSDTKEFTLVLAVKKMYKIFKEAEAAQDDSLTVNILKNMILHLNINDVDVVIMTEV